MIGPSTRVDAETAERIARDLGSALAMRRIFAADHPRVVDAIGRVATSLREVFSNSVIRFTLTTAGGMLVHEGIPLATAGGIDGLVKCWVRHRCGGIAVRPGFDTEGVRTLIDWLSDRRGEPLAYPIAGIEILEVGAGEELAGSILDPLHEVAPEFALATRVHRMANTVLGHVMADLRAGRVADFAEIDELAKCVADAARGEGATLLAPVQARHRAGGEHNHAVNVFMISTTLLQPFARDHDELVRFSKAALLHDVGQSKVSREILGREDLDGEDMAELQRHPVYGAEILERSRHAEPMAIQVAFCHHMRDHGLGYPSTILPIAPGPVAAMVQVADLFEFASPQAGSVAEAARAIFRTPGMKPGRAALKTLFERMTNSPPGSGVTLTTGERGLVIGVFAEQPDRPLVRILHDADGEPVHEPYEIDLRDIAPEENSIVEICLKPDLREVAYVLGE